MKVGVTQGTRDSVNNLGTNSYGQYQNEEATHDFISTIDSIQTCSVCGMGGHSLYKCHILITSVKGQDFIKAHPDVVERIHKSHKTFIHHKPFPHGAHVHNVMDEHSIAEECMKELHHDHPSLQFNADGYIYHLHDTPATNQEDDGSNGVMLIHSDPFGGPMVHFIDADRAYDHTIEDLIIFNVHTDDDDEDVSTT
jgi:hypothetical protein